MNKYSCILFYLNAGVKSAGVEWIYIHKDELLKVKPDITLKSPKDILKYI